MRKQEKPHKENKLLGNLLEKLPPPPPTLLEKKIELENYLQHDHFDYELEQTPNKEND